MTDWLGLGIAKSAIDKIAANINLGKRGSDGHARG